MRTKLALALLLFVALNAAAADAPSPIRVTADPMLQIAPSDQKASGLVWIANDSKEDVPLELNVGLFSVDATHRLIPAQVTLSGATKVVPAGKTPVRIEVAVTDAWPGGGASAPLRNAGTQIGTIHLVSFPFRVMPEGYKEGAAYPLRLRAEGGGQFMLVNNDELPYFVGWKLSLPGTDDIGDTVKIPPNSTVTIKVPAKPAWFPRDLNLAALFREPEADASLVLNALTAGGKSVQTWPIQGFRIRLSRAFWSDAWRPWVASVVLFFVLAAGGGCSLVLTNWVPNRTLKLQIQSRLDNLASAVRNLSTSINSLVRVGTRVERLRISDALDSRWIFSADYPALAKACEADVARLEKVVGLAQQIDNIYQDAFSTLGSFVPTLMRRAFDAAKEAEQQLDGRVVTDGDLAAAERFVGQARNALDGIRALTDDFKQDLGSRTASVKKQIDELRSKNNAFVVRVLKQLNTLESKLAETITPETFAAIDTACVKGQVIADVAPVVDALPQDEWKDIVQRLIDDLRGDNLSLLRRAQVRVRELRDQVRIETVIEAVESSAYSIIVEPSEPKAGETARLRISFHDRRINTSAMRDELTCTWSFGDSWEETGGRVAHYFGGSRSWLRRALADFGWTWAQRRATVTYPVTVSFANEKGPIQSTTPLQPKRVTVTPRQRSHGYTEVEVVRLSVALFAAILGLLGGASEQIGKLDLVPGLIAVFLIGFAADQIKNIITAKSGSVPATT